MMSKQGKKLRESTKASCDTDHISTAEMESTIQETKEKNEGHLNLYRISDETKKILLSRNISSLFPIQQKTFDAIYDGKHVIGRARTGTGKTLAYALPTIESLSFFNRFSKKGCRVLVLVPTRELAQQVTSEFVILSRKNTLFQSVSLVGGVSEEPQVRALNQGAQVVVGTPGRILDLLGRSLLDLKKLRVFILDEADQMLEMGFKEDVDNVLQNIATCKKSKDKNLHVQILLFTATLPAWVIGIANTYMNEGEKITVDIVENEQVSTAKGIRHLTIVCGFHQRSMVLENVIAYYAGSSGRCIVFVETKANANDISMNSGISHFCQVLHGDIPQKQRESTLKAFKDGKFRCLVATDVAARGLHVDNIELVIQLEPPKDVDTFIHRSGRTGRAGAKGINIVFINPMNAPFMKTIEAATGIKFSRVGIPQMEQLLSSKALEIVEQVFQKKPCEEDLNRCKDAAKTLLSQTTPEKAVCLLILQLAGFMEKSSQAKLVYSILSGNEGYRTYHITFLTNTKIKSKNYIWQVLKNGVAVDQNTLNNVRYFFLFFNK
jgi:ATP-dependent RNA helicase DDX21